MKSNMHIIIKCEKCKRIVSQCRCPDKNKVVRYVPTCAVCDSKEKNRSQDATAFAVVGTL